MSWKLLNRAGEGRGTGQFVKMDFGASGLAGWKDFGLKVFSMEFLNFIDTKALQG